jgi:hypothetical protein
MSVVGSADIILTSCVVRALAAGELRTTYTFRCETQERTCRLGTNQAAEESGLRAVNGGFVSHGRAELRQYKKRNQN